MNRDFFQQNIAPTLPHAPGVYKYYGMDKKILYVGKAKDLKKRVSSYFAKQHETRKTTRLVTLIDTMEWTVTNNEHDAFLLENSLIKHFRPPFNINLKDDKSYPYVVIRKEPFPRVYLTRRMVRDGSEYIGPFTGVTVVRELLDMIKEAIPLRTCGLNLTPHNIRRGKFKVCLEYHLGNCKGPCEGLQTEQEYKANIDFIRQLVKGNLGPVLSALREEMATAASHLEYEKAQQIKLKIEALQQYQSRSTVVSSHLINTDVATIIAYEERAYVNYMIVVEGKIIHSKSLLIEKKLDETPEEMLAYAIAFLRPKFQSQSKEVVVPFTVATEDEHLTITVPLAGDRKKLLDLSFKNAEYFKQEQQQKSRLLLKDRTDTDRMEILEQLQDDLQMNQLPLHIECFDNSNFQGSFPVAAMVCFKGGIPSKKDYRHFHIKTVEGINDFASMAEVVKRRYKRLMDEKQPLPQLVIIDGGKGQLGAAMESIEALGLTGRMTIAGLAKREESIFFPGDKDPLQLPYNGQSLLLIRRIRDEVHRFGIAFHRDTRSKGTIKNEIEEIPGIGAKTAQTLLQTYRSVHRVKEMTLRELTMTIGASKARVVFEYFHPGE
ncbi:MAG: excinuclease ABC subunit UvrC [Edaphocola sp.]